jgi:hypothetical protein
MCTNSCKDWNPLEHNGVTPKVLLIGHDPRLQSSDNEAEFALYSNYYFEKKTLKGSEKRKYGLAASSFKQVTDNTNNKFRAEEIYVTNLCNNFLDHAPKGKTVLIPESIAKEGCERILEILSKYKTIEYIFPMSQQVNYWLQYFGFYDKDTDFLEKAAPKQVGIDNKPPYYEAIKQKDAPFLDICGNVYTLKTGQKLIPILHSKLYGKSPSYFPCYERIKEHFAK